MLKRLFFLLSLVPVIIMAQEFRNGAFYVVSPIPLEYEKQIVQISSLSGSWRIIDPFTNRALRLTDSGLGWGEENGSDELQKWTIKHVKDHMYTISPAHSSKKLARSTFSIKESCYFGSDEKRTYRFVSATNPDFVLGNGDNSNNNARIVVEKRDNLNRGQYWTIKTVALGRHVVCNAFYCQYFDDGGNNPNIDYLLQWPANPENWGNALLTIKPLENRVGVCQILSLNKNKMYTVRDGRMMLEDIDVNDANSWFYVEEVEKPRIKSPIWEDETIFEENKLPAVADYCPYASEHEMVADSVHYNKVWTEPQNNIRQYLDGTWKFDFVTSPEKRPDGIELSRADKEQFAEWDDITVPGCWEMQGYDRPIYCNVEYPHSNTPPFIKARDGYNSKGENYGVDPVGTYQRTFNVNKEWLSKRTIIHFGGIYSAAFVYLNGQYVGYTQGSNNVSEFDITKSVREGDNNLVVQVIRWCDGSYLECQDMFRMSGIFRSVYVYNIPETSIRDHYITSRFNSDYTKANLGVELKKEGNENLGDIVLKLFAPDGNLVGQSLATAIDSVTYNAKFVIDNPQLWNAESPLLYTVHVIQHDSNGKEQMAFSTKCGLREITIKNSLLYLNGKRLFLKGVNRHDTDPLTGRTVSVKSMEHDVLMMKRNNINTIRTSHYPNDTRMFGMFDYYGLYVCAEADLEDHANQSISDIVTWQPSFVDRVARLAGIYRNFPSIIMWSLGNESGAGKNFKYCYDKVHSLDSLRPIHYEGTRIDRDYGGSAYSDFYSKMYPSMHWMKDNTSNLDKPMFICEYAHAMGNAIGNLDHYWKAMEESNSTIGGCIWDWVDQAIYEPKEIKMGIYRLHTGYDFPGPHQGNFCSNGIVTAERNYTAKLAEVCGVFQNLDFKCDLRQYNFEKETAIRVYNKFSFSSTENIELEYEYMHNGTVIARGVRPLTHIMPNDSGTVVIPSVKNTYNRKPGELLLNVYAKYKSDTRFCLAGHVLARKQFVLNSSSKLLPVKPSGKTLAIDSTSNLLKISNNKICVVFEKNTGLMKSLLLHDKRIIADSMGFVFNNHRWIENDRYAHVSNELAPTGKVQIRCVDKKTCVVSTMRSGKIADQQIDYVIYSNGIIDMDVNILPHSDNLRRAGVACAIDSSMSRVEYYALGPWENYCDRNNGVMLGRYSTVIDSLKENYVKPQTTGDRGKMRELVLKDISGKGIRIQTEGDVSFSANRYTDEDLMNAKHQWELVKRPYIYMHLDGAQRGLGNASCGPGPMEEYIIPQKPVNFKLRLSGL